MMTTTNKSAQEVQRKKNVGISVTLDDAILMAIRHYNTIGDLKKARPTLNKVIARSKIAFGYKEVVKGYQEVAKECLTKEKEDILKNWQFEKVLENISPLIFENEIFGRIALDAVAAGIFSLKEPLKFVQRYSTYTDRNGVIYGKKTTLESEADKMVYVTRFSPITLTAVNAAKILESAFSNFHRIRKNAILGDKLDICYKVSDGQIYAKYEVITGENGEYIRGCKIK